MSTRSHRGPRPDAASSLTDVQPWPGKRSGTQPARVVRGGAAPPWPGKRTRAASLRRPPPTIEEPIAESIEESIEEPIAELVDDLAAAEPAEREPTGE